VRKPSDSGNLIVRYVCGAEGRASITARALGLTAERRPLVATNIDPLLTSIRLTGCSSSLRLLQMRLDELPEDDKRVEFVRDLLDVIEDEVNALAERIRRPVREDRVRNAHKRLGFGSEWDEFLGEHPELTDTPTDDDKPVALDIAAISDEEIIAAISEAIRQWSAWHEARGNEWRPESAYSREVARVLAGQTTNDDRVLVRDGDVIRVGQRLGALARAGRIRLVSKSYNPRAYAPLDEGTDA
jgi:hypothetical protein